MESVSHSFNLLTLAIKYTLYIKIGYVVLGHELYVVGVSRVVTLRVGGSNKV